MGELTRYKNRDGRDKVNLGKEKEGHIPKVSTSRAGKKPRNQKKPLLKSTFERERKYQSIKLAKSGRSLSEIKSFMKTGTAHLTDEYVNPQDLNALSQLAYGLNYIRLSRGQANEILKLRFNQNRKLPPNREEYIANFLIGGTIPINWKRDGNLIRRGKPNASRPGSSKNKMRTVVKGARKTNKAFKSLIATLKRLIRSGSKPRAKDIKGIAKAIKTSTKIDG